MQAGELITWLNRAWDVEKEIKKLEKTNREVFDRLTAVTKDYDRIVVKSSPDPHKLDGIAALDEKIVELIDRKAAIHAETIEAIFLLEDRRYRAILYDRYVDQLKWETIMDTENYSKAHVFRLHRKAVAALAAKLTETGD